MLAQSQFGHQLAQRLVLKAVEAAIQCQFCRVFRLFVFFRLFAVFRLFAGGFTYSEIETLVDGALTLLGSHVVLSVHIVLHLIILNAIADVHQFVR